MKRKILSLTLIVLLFISFCQIAYAGNVTISDTTLRATLYSLSGTPTSESLTTQKLAAITGNVDLSHMGISNIEGIQYLTGATSIDLSLNKIGDIPREIESLTSLESLNISGNKITRLPSNIGGMSGLKSLDIRANRLEALPSALSKLSLDEFYCDYNFFDLTEGSSDLNTINSIGAQKKEYTHQLSPVTNFSAYSPTAGTVVLYWDKVSSIVFDNGAVGEIRRFSVLDGNYNYVGEAIPGETTYEITGLDSSIEYKFHVSADYYVKNTEYSGEYTKLYRSVTVLPVPQNTPVMNATPTMTPTATPSPESIAEIATPEPATVPPQEGAVVTMAPIATASPTPTTEKTSGAVKAIYIILIVLVVIFVFITLLIISRAVNSRRNRNSRYRR